MIGIIGAMERRSGNVKGKAYRGSGRNKGCYGLL